MEQDQTQTPPTVFQTGLRYGLILSLVSIGFALLIIVIGVNPFSGNNWWQSIINLGITITAVVFAHNYFKSLGDGFMSYGQGFGIAFVVCLTSAVIGILFNVLYTSFIDPEMMQEILNMNRMQMEDRGMPQDQIDMAMGITERFLWVFAFLALALYSVVVALLIPIFTQRRKPEPGF